mgnify:CR=1 FL=1
MCSDVRSDYFNPRSHERSDKSFHFMLFVLCNFNPRSHERSDGRSWYCNWSGKISIHAPTRGATDLKGKHRYIASKFQSTLPREERLFLIVLFMIGVNFNPRSHERSDQGEESIMQDIKISIHAPTRGATIKPNAKSALIPIFQSTLPREERHTRPMTDQQEQKFQSTLPREERRSQSSSSSMIWYFNPRSHERSDKSLN